MTRRALLVALVFVSGWSLWRSAPAAADTAVFVEPQEVAVSPRDDTASRAVARWGARETPAGHTGAGRRLTLVRATDVGGAAPVELAPRAR